MLYPDGMVAFFIPPTIYKSVVFDIYYIYNPKNKKIIEIIYLNYKVLACPGPPKKTLRMFKKEWMIFSKTIFEF